MKKFILPLLMVLAGFCASAQGWVGGSIGLGVTSVSVDGNSQSTTQISIAPEFGYQITDNLAIAAEFEVDYAKAGDDKQTVWGVGPYVRYTVANYGAVSLFGEVAAHYVSSKYGDADAIGGYNLQLRPGLAISLSETCALVGKINLLEYLHLSKDGISVNTTAFEATTDLSVGFVYKF